jgi:Zn-dependent M16 (insulinase) family peptidase
MTSGVVLMRVLWLSPRVVSQLHYRTLKKALFRGHPVYAIDSGGDPRAIPTLTYDAFRAFHQQYYHPANARLFVYGKEEEMPVAERLALLEQWLGEFGAPDFDADEKARSP